MGARREGGPSPYNRNELRVLHATLDERWPLLAHDDARRWLERVRDKRSPYSRVRPHAIGLQLRAIVALALHQGLRRGEIWRAEIYDIAADNFGVVVRERERQLREPREVPYTSAARESVAEWLACRGFLGAEHRTAWLNLHAEPTKSAPMTRYTFEKLPHTYIGPGWSYKRLRDTCAAGWVRSGLPLEHLRQLLGLSRIEETLPYARLVRGSLEGEMDKRDELFVSLVEPTGLTI